MEFLPVFLATAISALTCSINMRIVDKVEPQIMMFIHSLLTLLIIGPWVLYKPEPLLSTIHDNRFYLMILTNLLGLCVGYSMLTSIKLIGPMLTSSLHLLQPVMVALVCWVLYSIKPDKTFWIGASLIMIGSIIVTRR